MGEKFDLSRYKIFFLGLNLFASIVTIYAWLVSIISSMSFVIVILVIVSIGLFFYFVTSRTNQFGFIRDYEECNTKFTINKKSRTIVSDTLHSYKTTVLKDRLECVEHHFSLFDYRSLPCMHIDESYLSGSLKSDYNNSKLEIVRFSNSNIRLKIKFTPPLSSSKTVLYSFNKKSINSLFLTKSELFSAIGSGNHPSNKPFCYRAVKINSPTTTLCIRVEFPDWYKASSLDLYEMYNGDIMREKLKEIQIQKIPGHESNIYQVKISERFLKIGKHYLLTWLPPE